MGLVGGWLMLMGLLPKIQSIDFYSWSPMVGISVIHVWLILIATLFTKAKFVCPVCYHINTVPPVYYFSFNCSRDHFKSHNCYLSYYWWSKICGHHQRCLPGSRPDLPIKTWNRKHIQNSAISQAFLSTSKCIVLIIAKFRLYLRIRLLLC